MADPIIPAAPILGHVEGVELIDTGDWLASTGPFKPTSTDLIAAVEAMDCPAVRRPVLKAGHSDDPVGEPALGYVDNLRLANQAQTLIGDYRGMPGWLTDVDDDGQSILASAYPDRSIEGEYDYRCQLGHTHRFVVHAVALLGIERPAIGTLQSLQELYGVVAATTASEGGRLVTLTHQQEASMPQPPEPQRVSAAATTDDVRRAYYASPEGSDWDLWIREMYVEPPELIVDNDGDGSILRVPYTVSGDEVTFGEAQPVKVTYVAARASSGDAVVRFPDRAMSRPGEAPSASADAPQAPVAPASGSSSTGEEPVVSNDLLTDLRQKLGVAEDADEATTLAALDEALEERADDTSQETAPAVPEGMTVIETDVLEGLKTAASAGQEARKQQLTEARDRTIDAAVKAGKITPARKEHWATAYDADPEGTQQTLASLPAGLVPVEFAGDAGSPEATTDDATYNALFGDEKAGV